MRFSRFQDRRDALSSERFARYSQRTPGSLGGRTSTWYRGGLGRREPLPLVDPLTPPAAESGSSEYAIAALRTYPGASSAYPPGWNLVPCGIVVNTGPFVIPASGYGIQYTGSVARWAEIEAAFRFGGSMATVQALEVYMNPTGVGYEQDRRAVLSPSGSDAPSLRVTGRFKLEPNIEVVPQVYHDDTSAVTCQNFADALQVQSDSHFLSVRLL